MEDKELVAEGLGMGLRTLLILAVAVGKGKLPGCWGQELSWDWGGRMEVYRELLPVAIDCTGIAEILETIWGGRGG